MAEKCSDQFLSEFSDSSGLVRDGLVSGKSTTPTLTLVLHRYGFMCRQYVDVDSVDDVKDT